MNSNEHRAVKFETDSPFFRHNKMLYNNFKAFIESKQGKFKGDYNAWSYAMIGKITELSLWTLKYKKATFTSGNLLLSSKAQTTITSAEWSTRVKGLPDLFIRKKSGFDGLRLFANSKLSYFRSFKSYITNADLQTQKDLKNFLDLLEPLFNTNEIDHITVNNGLLNIYIKTEDLQIDIIKKIIEIKL